MAERNLDIALRIKADLDSARAGLDQLNKTLGTTGKQADTTNASLGRSSQRFDALVASTTQVVQLLQSMDARLESIASGSAQAAQATEQVAVTTQAAAAAVRQLAETEDEAAARIRAVIAASRERQAVQETGAKATSDAAAASGAQAVSAEETAAAIQRQTAQTQRWTSAEAAATAAAQRTAGATAEEAAELGRLLGQIDPTIAALERLDQQEAALQRYRNTGLLDEEGFQRFRGQIEQSRTALGRMGVSAGQTRQAMRQLPAQITDVTVSLAAGMPVWLVALQQGGQIKDSFGGIRPALQGVLSVLTPMRIAVGGLVGVLGLLTFEAVKGYLEQQRLASALLATGNYAGYTTTQLRNIAEEIGGSSGAYADANRAVLLLAQSGRLSGDALRDAAQAAVSMAQLTGQSMDSAVASVVRLADDPVRAAKQLDDQFHFLAASSYQQILSLQDQGKSADALALALKELANTMQARRERDVENLGYIQRGWKSLNDEIERGLQLIKQYGSQDLSQQLDQLYFKRGLAQSLPDFLGKDKIAAIDEQIAALKDLQDQREKAALAGAKQDAENKQGRAAVDRLHDLAKGYDKVADRQKIIKKLNDDIALQYKTTATLPAGVDMAQGGGFSGKGYDFLLKKALGESTKAPKVKATNALAAAQQQLQNQILALGDNALGPVTGIWDKYTQAMLAAASVGGKAIKAGGDVAAVQAQVQQVQALASAARDKALADQQRGLQIAYAQATGDQATAAKLQIDAQYGDLLTDLQRRGDAAGVRLVRSLINVGEARAQLQQLQQQVDTILGDQSRQEQAIQAEQQAGLVSDYSARKQILDLHQATAAQLDQLIPKMRELVAATGDPRAVEQLKNLEAELGRLKLKTNDLKTAFEGGLTSGLEQALTGLSNRTLTVAGAFRALATTVVQSLAQVAARALAAKAIGAISSLFGDSNKTADVSQGATKLAVAGGIVGGAAGLLGVNADKLMASATALAAANSIGLVGGFAAGGYTGPGGVTQVAGIVHAGEYVQPQYRMSEPGAIAFMRDFHQRGMDAIGAWSTVGYAQGGLVAPLADVPRLQARATPRAPLPAAANDPRGGAGAAVHFKNVNVVDPDLVAGYLRGNGGRDAVLNIIRDNRSTVRQYVNR